MHSKETSEKTEAKDKIFYTKHTLNIGGQLYPVDRPQIVGILNLTPDSFYDGGCYAHEENIRSRIGKMLADGADIIDLGAASTRPGAMPVPAREEIARLQPALQILTREFPNVIVSVDTYQAEVARAAVDMGTHMINDISGGTMDNAMFATVAELAVPYVLMHIRGTPQTMQQDPQYNDVFKEVCHFFSRQINALLDKGVNDIILDPGFGFGKTMEHNYELLSRLEHLKIFERPVYVGVSRKGMISKLLNIRAEDALNGSTAAHTIALLKGASFLRVHDVKEASEAAKIVTFTQKFTECPS